jgi:hypothetical protein
VQSAVGVSSGASTAAALTAETIAAVGSSLGSGDASGQGITAAIGSATGSGDASGQVGGTGSGDVPGAEFGQPGDPWWQFYGAAYARGDLRRPAPRIVRASATASGEGFASGVGAFTKRFDPDTELRRLLSDPQLAQALEEQIRREDEELLLKGVL